jgi:hypothetical protein
MLVPVIEYVVRTKTKVRAYPSTSAPSVGFVGKREILVALEERCDQVEVGFLWVQFRSSRLTVDSHLGWVIVEAPWGDSNPDSSLPQKVGLPKDLETYAEPPKGTTLGFSFTETPQPVFLLSRYRSEKNSDIHWRHAFMKAKITSGEVVCPTTMVTVSPVHTL